jgi:hypothetical protein
VSADPVREIADAVLYEGYVLWPYTRSALKNQQRFTFGGVYPEGWPEDRSERLTECLLEAPRGVRAEARVRFLQVMRRQLLDSAGAPVDELMVDGDRHLTWDEATERELALPVPGRVPIEIAAGERVDELGEGSVRRSWQGLRGVVEATTTELRRGLQRLSLRIANTWRWDGEDRAGTLERTFCSTHAVLRTETGGFVSATDPPAELREAAASCRNDGAWPVLVGEPGDRRTMLAAPIILEDYPRVAPESPGDLFDSAEIDQLLSVTVLALTEREKAEMRATDPRVREILERTESMSGADLMKLHGTIRELRFLGR